MIYINKKHSYIITMYIIINPQVIIQIYKYESNYGYSILFCSKHLQ